MLTKNEEDNPIIYCRLTKRLHIHQRLSHEHQVLFEHDYAAQNVPTGFKKFNNSSASLTPTPHPKKKRRKITQLFMDSHQIHLNPKSSIDSP